MTPKIQRIAVEIEKISTRVAELQERLCELERQKTELENTEIVALFRSLEIAPDKLPGFIAAMQQPDLLPRTAPAPIDSGGSAAYASAFTRREEDEDEV